MREGEIEIMREGERDFERRRAIHKEKEEERDNERKREIMRKIER